jgi:hypothetical protein
MIAVKKQLLAIMEGFRKIAKYKAVMIQFDVDPQ